MTQTAAILRLLKERRDGITAMDALEHAGSLRLAARISDLRAEGFIITTDLVTLPNGKTVGRYRLREREPYQVAS